MSDLADRLREIRLAAGISRRELADLSGVTPRRIDRIEHGLSLPRENEILAVLHGANAGDQKAEVLALWARGLPKVVEEYV